MPTHFNIRKDLFHDSRNCLCALLNHVPCVIGLDPPPLYSTAPHNLTVAGSSADTSLEHRARQDLARYLTTEFAGQAKRHAIRINGHRKILRLSLR
jgi:hypothetical protein